MTQESEINKIEKDIIENTVQENLSTEVTKEDLKEAIEDEYGVKYSKDGKRLLKATSSFYSELIIQKGTKVICDRAFEFCIFRKSITLPEGVITIGRRAFQNCASLTITLPSSLKKIEGNPFPGTFCTLINNSPQFCVEARFLYSADKKKLFSGVSLSSTIHVPEGVTTIGEGAFECSTYLESIMIPESVTTIECRAFQNCPSLKSITIPKEVTTIEDRVFEGCKSLESITIPEEVTTIKDNAFKGCSSLRSITLPSSLKKIEGYPFPRNLCKHINKSSYFCIEGGILYSSDKKKLISCASSSNTIHISEGVTTIGERAFSGCIFLKLITIPESVTTIEEGAFRSCKFLKSITIPKGMTAIEENAFRDCKSLESFTIPESVTKIEKNAFRGCKSLESIKIPEGVTTIGERAFQHCFSLKSITIPERVTAIEEYAFFGCSSLKQDIRDEILKRFPSLTI